MRRPGSKCITASVALSLSSLMLLAACQRGASPPGSVTSRTATIERGTIEVKVSATGDIAPATYASLNFTLAGVVLAVPAEVGDQVKAGDTLIELDPASIGSSIIQAQADWIDAKQALKKLLEPPTSFELAQAEQAVLEADKAIQDAERHLSGIKYPDVADYHQALDDAYVTLQNAQSNQTITDVGAPTNTLNAAQDAVDRAAEQLGQAQTAENGCGGCDPDRLRRAQDNYNGALNSLTTAQLQLQTAQAGNEQTIRTAQDSVDEAQRNLAAAEAGPRASDVALAEAQLATAKAQYEKAVKDMADMKGGPDPDDVAAAKARVAAAQARVDEIRLVAPFAGTVVAVNYGPGDTVTPGATGLVVADLSQLHIDTRVDELDIAQVTPGQPVNITLDALPGVNLTGRIGRIDLASDRTQTTVQYPVRVELDTTDQPVRIGMTAALEILVARRENALLVPNWALRVDREKGGTYVTVQRGRASAETTVELGLRNDSVSEVVSGLAAGDVVGVVVTPEPQQGPFGGGG